MTAGARSPAVAPDPGHSGERTPSRIRFQVTAVPGERFDPLRALDDGALRARGARRVRVDGKPGFPCRVSLADAEVGEEVLLVSFTHHDVDTPYRSSGPIYVRLAAVTARPGVNEVPEMLRSRFLSIRGYDAAGMLVSAGLGEGRELEDHLERVFSDPRVAYLHLHNARPGCFNCRVDRA